MIVFEFVYRVAELHGKITLASPKVPCADLDCITAPECVRVGLSHITAHANVTTRPGVSNFAQTPDGQRRNSISNRYAIAKRSVFNSTR